MPDSPSAISNPPSPTQPPRLEHPVRITDQSWPEGTVPVVTVQCTTYNHVKFIRDAIEGFLMQETTFPVEILIHDDASTDGTQDIIRDYQIKYPKLVQTILQKENQWSQGCFSKIRETLISVIRGEFIATCEGDDYWTDSAKLQIQAIFLLNNPDYVACIHDAAVVDQNRVKQSDSVLPITHKQDSSKEDLLLSKRILPTLTLMYRNVIKNIPMEMQQVTNPDNFRWVLLGRHGKCKYIKEIAPACYRIHAGGIWSDKTEREKTIESISTYTMIYKYFKREGMNEYADYYFRRVTIWALSIARIEDIYAQLKWRFTSKIRKSLKM